MKNPHYIKQWRKYRGLTQERLASRLDMNQGHLSQIENYKRGYNQGLLEAIADALSCVPADLIMRDPTKSEALWSIWEQVPDNQRTQVMEIIETFVHEGKETGT